MKPRNFALEIKKKNKKNILDKILERKKKYTYTPTIKLIIIIKLKFF